MNFSEADTMISNSSDEDEDDDIYTNAAARLKALKAMKPVPKSIPEDDVEETPIVNVIEDCDINATNNPLTSEISDGGSRPRRNRRARVTATKIPTNSPLITIDLDDFISDPSPIRINSYNDVAEAIVISDTETEVPNIIEDNYMMDVKVRWRSRKIERIKLGMNEKFAKIFQYFSSLKNVSENQILLTRKEIPINRSDTPASVNLKIIDILEGGIVDTPFAINSEDIEPVCKIKVQSSSSTRHYLTYNLCKNDRFEKLFEYCAKEKNILPSKIKLFFDGELVSPSDTPDSLDLDDEACVDLQIT